MLTLDHFKEVKVLDKGFIRLISTMGSDQDIVDAARVSYGKGTKKLSDDRGLIRSMMRHGHTTPFEMCEIKFHVKSPMDCWRQWIRQRTANVNEYSTRYSEVQDEFHVTQENEWRFQSKKSKQGSEGPVDPQQGFHMTSAEQMNQIKSYTLYYDLITAGVAREQARKVLPLSTYTTAYWKIDLHNLFNFLEKRMAPDAQFEIRQYANVIANIVKDWVPLAWEAFQDYRVNAIKLSASEVKAIYDFITTQGATAIIHDGVSKRETEEFSAKLQRLGFGVTTPTEVPPTEEVK